MSLLSWLVLGVYVAGVVVAVVTSVRTFRASPVEAHPEPSRCPCAGCVAFRAGQESAVVLGAAFVQLGTVAQWRRPA